MDRVANYVKNHLVVKEAVYVVVLVVKNGRASADDSDNKGAYEVDSTAEFTRARSSYNQQ